MNTLLITKNTFGQARNYLAKSMLTSAFTEAGLKLTDQINDADLVIAFDQSNLNDTNLVGKQIFVGDIEQAIRQPAVFLSTAKNNAVEWHAPTVNPDEMSGQKRIVAVTACPTGVAHTFMAAEAIETEAKKRGWWVKVETRGSVGTGNAVTPEEIAQADLVFVAADIEVDLNKFAGKPMYRTSTGLALKKTAQEFDKAFKEAQIFESKTQTTQTASSGQKSSSSGIYRHLLTGVSYMLPMVVAGGLCIALSLIFGINAYKETGSLAAALHQIGADTAFKLMVPILAGYIAFSIADRPGLVPGMIGGMLADIVGAGFLGGILAGFLAGYVAKFISTKLRLPQSLESLKPILIIPLIASLITGLIMIFVIGTPVASIMASLKAWVEAAGKGNAGIILGAVLGLMMCVDMGGPINKAAYAASVALVSENLYMPMAVTMAAGMVPPLAIGLSTLIARRKFDQADRDSGKTALVLGMCFISEGVLPFAARDPMRVIPCCMVGGALTGALSMAVGAELKAPHGGLFVLAIPGAISPVLGYLLAILAGTLVSGIAYAIVKRPESKEVENVI